MSQGGIEQILRTRAPRTEPDGVTTSLGWKVSVLWAKEDRRVGGPV